MDPEVWQQVNELYHGAWQREGEERARFLDEACGDPEIRREVESLLAIEPRDRSLLDHPAWEKRLLPVSASDLMRLFSN